MAAKPAATIRLAPWLTLALVICLADQATKYWASTALTYALPHPVWPSFNLTLLHNTGAAFSFLSDGSGWQRWFFTAIALVISVVVVVWISRLERGQRWAPCALALILGGAIGNVIDRITLGYVVDFIQVYYKSWSWPAFNIADSAISVGAVMLILRGPGRAGEDPGARSAPEA